MGCGRIAPKAELLRVAAVGDRATPDPEGRLPGRGAYVCPTGDCWRRAVRRKAFARAFRRPVTADPEP